MTSQERAEERFREMLGVSIKMDFNDARQCALISLWKEVESLSKAMPYGLDYLFKRDDIMDQITHLENLDLAIYYKNIRQERLDYDVHG